MTETITLTFGEQAENHRGMEILGNGLRNGFTCEELEKSKNLFEKAGLKCEHIYLGTELKIEASVLVVKGGALFLSEKYSENIFEKHKNLNWDTKAYMYGRVVNKNARYNLCFGDEDREPDYENKKGRIVKFTKAIKTIRKNLPNFFGEKAKDLQCEGNFYHNINQCGIGYHGDTERHIVIGVRLGATIPIVFRWYKNSNRIEELQPVTIILEHGDLYVMSQKATGFDWKTRSIETLRHAAGAKKFIE